ncbi:hypothetical protein H0H93_001180, partial [Arthromyces matolae]
MVGEDDGAEAGRGVMVDESLEVQGDKDEGIETETETETGVREEVEMQSPSSPTSLVSVSSFGDIPFVPGLDLDEETLPHEIESVEPEVYAEVENYSPSSRSSSPTPEWPIMKLPPTSSSLMSSLPSSSSSPLLTTPTLSEEHGSCEDGGEGTSVEGVNEEQ